jgi:hypothetical protein
LATKRGNNIIVIEIDAVCECFAGRWKQVVPRFVVLTCPATKSIPSGIVVGECPWTMADGTPAIDTLDSYTHPGCSHLICPVVFLSHPGFPESDVNRWVICVGDDFLQDGKNIGSHPRPAERDMSVTEVVEPFLMTDEVVFCSTFTHEVSLRELTYHR